MAGPPTVADPTTTVLTGAPDLTRLFARAALTSRGRGGDLPRTRVVLHGQAVDPDHLARYARVCGFALSQRLPVTFLHVLAFPLQVELMASRAFPLPLAGMVHVRNEITAHRAVTVDEVLDLRVWASDLREHRKGALVDLHGEVRVGEEEVWHGRSTYLARGRSVPPGGSTLPADEDRPLGGLAVPDRASALVRVPSDEGRRYAAVSGDVNPIHLTPLAAKAFGFPRAIAHGMWTHARSLAALEGRVGPRVRVVAEFAKPVLLPSTVALHTVVDGGAAVVELRPSRRDGLHVRTTVEPLPGA